VAEPNQDELIEKYRAYVGHVAEIYIDQRELLRWLHAEAVWQRDEARRERDLAVAHDRQPYPTAWAFEQVCRADREKRARIDAALELLEDAPGMELTRVGIDALRVKLQGDHPVRPRFSGPMQPVHPCRQIPTRHCPAVYDAECGDRPCARFESEDETPWLPELPAAKRPAEPDVTPPDPSGRIVDHGLVQPFTDTDLEETA
jgi:hypothetical protein